MSIIVKSNLVKKGKIIDNYLVNFPQFINKLKDSIYKLIINLDVSVFVVNIPSSNYTIELPYKPFDLEQENCYVLWNDQNNENDYRSLSHTYSTSGTYTITVIGLTSNLFSISNMLNTTSGLDNFISSLVDIRKLSDSLTDLKGAFKNYPNLSGIPDLSLPSHTKDCSLMFKGCTNLEYIPFNFNLPLEGTNFSSMFEDCPLKIIFNLNLSLPVLTSNADFMFANTTIELFPNNFFYNVDENLTSLNGTFSGCYNLKNFTSSKSLPYIKVINNLFDNCSNIKTILLNVPYITSLSSVCYECNNLNTVNGIKITDNTEDATLAFYNCYNLNNNIDDVFEYSDKINTSSIFSTFFNCKELKGIAKELYLWKSKTADETQLNTFSGCSHLLNYNFISESWGGPSDITYWYGSYLVSILKDNDIYCLPIYKFIDGNSYSTANRSYNIFNPNPDLLATYDFYINYGDDDKWLYTQIDNSIFFNEMWLNDPLSPFFGYPKTYTINFNDQDTMTIYDNLVYHNMYSYIYKNITRLYKKAGVYKITIIGRVPRFYVSLKDNLTNRHLYNLITINRLPFTTLDHAFTNAYNLRYLPNEDLTKFPLLDVTTVSGLVTWTYDLENNKVTITPLYIYDDKLHEIPASGTEYCFANIEGSEDKLLANPPLFNINTTSTTFLYRKK